jgi:hypothetical protein
MNIAVRLGYLLAVGTGIMLLLILHSPPAWFPLITEAYARIRWTIDLALGAVIVAYTWLIFDDPPWLKHFALAILNILFLFAVYSLYRVFPFEFGASFWVRLTRGILLLAAAASAIGIVIEMAWLLAGHEGQPEAKE